MTRTSALVRTAVLSAVVLLQVGLCAAQDLPALPPGLAEPPSASQPSRIDQPEGPALPPGLAEPEGPALPSGLGGPEGPQLPSGLDEPGAPEGPSLPEGLEEEPAPPGEKPEAEGKTFEDMLHDLGVNGFWESLAGIRTQHDRHEKWPSASETRLQVLWEKRLEEATLRFRGDLMYDDVAPSGRHDTYESDGWFDLREANISLRPLKFMDLRIGRQIITWGTGDLVFVNDLFPKDYRSFFIGRDTDYLRAPSDSVRATFFSDLANLDVVYTPLFNPDRLITGRRLSYYNPMAGGVVGDNMILRPDEPNRWFRDATYAARLYRTINGVELAGYGYWGYWTTPEGVDPRKGVPTYPRLNVYGGSIRGQLAGGIANFEAAYYDSSEDRSGSNPFVRNSEARFLIGYERDLPKVARDLTVGVQYLLQPRMHNDRFLANRLPGQPAGEEIYQQATLRITKLLMNQNLAVSLFGFYSPTDADAYLRPSISYKLDDHWEASFGGNIFFGARPDSFWGQFADNSNIYARLRYSF